MKKIGLVVLGMLIVSIVLAGCAQESKTSDAQLESELSQLSDQELQDVADQAQVEESQALAGQAFKKVVSTGGKTYPTRNTALIANKIIKQRQQLKIAELNKTVVKLNQTLVNITNVTRPVNVTNQT